MLTERQEAILEYIRSYQELERVPPSSRLVQRQFRFSSQTTALRHLRSLAEKGLLIQFSDGRWGVKSAGVQRHFAEIPVYGSIPAGEPAFREQEPGELIAVDMRLLRTKGRAWAVRVQGDSMIDAHILEGDIAVLEKREPQPGEIIAALVDGTSTTLKRLLVEKGRPLLRAANERYADIYPTTLECQGVLVGLVRTVNSHT